MDNRRRKKDGEGLKANVTVHLPRWAMKVISLHRMEQLWSGTGKPVNREELGRKPASCDRGLRFGKQAPLLLTHSYNAGIASGAN